MNISKMMIFHTTNYLKTYDPGKLLEKFTTKVHPVILSTCMRQIRLFEQGEENIDIRPYKDIAEKPESENKKTILNLSTEIKSDYIKGEEAYSFLIYWTLGALHCSKPFDDDRLLGQLRTIVLEYEYAGSDVKKKVFKKYEKILKDLVIDTTAMHKVLLDKKHLSEADKEVIFKQACNNCAWARNLGLLDVIHLKYEECCNDRNSFIKKCLSALDFSENKLEKNLEKTIKKAARLGLGFFTPKHILAELEEVFFFRDLLSTLAQENEALLPKPPQ